MNNGTRAKNGHAIQNGHTAPFVNGKSVKSGKRHAELKLTSYASRNGFDEKVEMEMPIPTLATKPQLSIFRHYAGIFLILMASFLFALMALMIKHLDQFHKFSLGFFRFQGILLPSLAFLIHARCTQGPKIFDSLWPICKNWTTLVLLCVRYRFSYFGLCTKFYRVVVISFFLAFMKIFRIFQVFGAFIRKKHF